MERRAKNPKSEEALAKKAQKVMERFPELLVRELPRDPQRTAAPTGDSQVGAAVEGYSLDALPVRLVVEGVAVSVRASQLGGRGLINDDGGTRVELQD